MNFKNIFTARSSVFRAMFDNSMKESNQNLVLIDDMSPHTMEHFRSFLYCGKFQQDSWIKHLPSLVNCAEKARLSIMLIG